MKGFRSVRFWRKKRENQESSVALNEKREDRETSVVVSEKEEERKTSFILRKKKEEKSRETSVANMESSTTANTVLYTIAWALLLVFLAWPLAWFCVSCWIFLLPFEGLVLVLFKSDVGE